MASRLVDLVRQSAHRIPMPIGVFAGLELTGTTVKDVVTNAKAQTEAVLALHEFFNTELLLTAMDLSAEAELFGCQVNMTEEEIPSVIDRLLKTSYDVSQLDIPEINLGRTRIHLDSAADLVKHAQGYPVLGGVIGPFSLAGRLFGVSEALELSITDPHTLSQLLEKVTEFLIVYIKAFRQVGTWGVIMAEPAAGLLSPRAMGQFSTQYIKQIVDMVNDENFTVVYHNCGAKLVHLSSIIQSGAEIYHFGASMDILSALSRVDEKVILAGNLDPVNIFHSMTADKVYHHTHELMDQTKNKSNFIISSGCDIPPHTSLDNLGAFFSAVRDFPYLQTR